MVSRKDKSGLPPQASSSGADLDPIAIALRPPADEPPAQRAARLRDEAEAKKRSDLIDAQIQADRDEREKAKKRGDIKILLLGESNSSATLPDCFSTYSSSCKTSVPLATHTTPYVVLSMSYTLHWSEFANCPPL